MCYLIHHRDTEDTEKSFKRVRKFHHRDTEDTEKSFKRVRKFHHGDTVCGQMGSGQANRLE